MRKTQTRPPRTFGYDTGLDLLLKEVRREDLPRQAEVCAARIEEMAMYISIYRPTCTDAAELLREVAQNIRNAAKEIC